MIHQWVNESLNRWINQCITEPRNQWTNDATIEWVNEWMNQWINESINGGISESMNQLFNVSVSQWINEAVNNYSMKQWNNASTIQWVNESVNQLNHWMNERCNQQINEWTNLANLSFQKCSNPPRFLQFFMWNQALATVSCAFCQLHRPTVIRSTQFFAIFQCKANSTLKCACCSRYSLVHISPTSSFKSVPVPIPSVLFVTVFMWNWLKLSSQKSPVHILPTLSSKSAPAASVFNDFYVQIELSLQSCALFVDNFPRSMPATLETAILFRRPRKPLSLKKHRVSHPRVFTREFTRFRISLFPTTWWWWWWRRRRRWRWRWWWWWCDSCGWHDNVVDMVRHEHSDKTTPGHSPVTRKFSN